MNDRRRSDYLGVMDQAVSDTKELGTAQRARIMRDALAARNSVGGQLAGNGLYNTTVQENMKQGVDRNREEAIGGLEESLRQQLLDVMMRRAEGLDGITGDSIANQREVGTTGIGVLAQKAGFNPTTSTSTSQSTSTNNSVGFRDPNSGGITGFRTNFRT